MIQRNWNNISIYLHIKLKIKNNIYEPNLELAAKLTTYMNNNPLKMKRTSTRITITEKNIKIQLI